jgi:hypothetical protein
MEQHIFQNDIDYMGRCLKCITIEQHVLDTNAGKQPSLAAIDV